MRYIFNLILAAVCIINSPACDDPVYAAGLFFAKNNAGKIVSYVTEPKLTDIAQKLRSFSNYKVIDQNKLELLKHTELDYSNEVMLVSPLCEPGFNVAYSILATTKLYNRIMGSGRYRIRKNIRLRRDMVSVLARLVGDADTVIYISPKITEVYRDLKGKRISNFDPEKYAVITEKGSKVMEIETLQTITITSGAEDDMDIEI